MLSFAVLPKKSELIIATIGRIVKGKGLTDLLDAFHATLDESLQCDLLLLLADSSDDEGEIIRKLETSHREIIERRTDSNLKIIVVLTKSDKECNESSLIGVVNELGFSDPIVVSAHTGDGIKELKEENRRKL